VDQENIAPRVLGGNFLVPKELIASRILLLITNICVQLELIPKILELPVQILVLPVQKVIIAQKVLNYQLPVLQDIIVKLVLKIILEQVELQQLLVLLVLMVVWTLFGSRANA
jgi:hypothetical protein